MKGGAGLSSRSRFRASQTFPESLFVRHSGRTIVLARFGSTFCFMLAQRCSLAAGELHSQISSVTRQWFFA